MGEKLNIFRKTPEQIQAEQKKRESEARIKREDRESQAKIKREEEEAKRERKEEGKRRKEAEKRRKEQKEREDKELKERLEKIRKEEEQRKKQEKQRKKDEEQKQKEQKKEEERKRKEVEKIKENTERLNKIAQEKKAKEIRRLYVDDAGVEMPDKKLQNKIMELMEINPSSVKPEAMKEDAEMQKLRGQLGIGREKPEIKVEPPTKGKEGEHALLNALIGKEGKNGFSGDPVKDKARAQEFSKTWGFPFDDKSWEEFSKTTEKENDLPERWKKFIGFMVEGEKK